VNGLSLNVICSPRSGERPATLATSRKLQALVGDGESGSDPRCGISSCGVGGIRLAAEIRIVKEEQFYDFVLFARPRISSTPSTWLFPNPSGVGRNVVGFGKQMSTAILRHTGIEMHPPANKAYDDLNQTKRDQIGSLGTP
jgi:hypothetical protein